MSNQLTSELCSTLRKEAWWASASMVTYIFIMSPRFGATFYASWWSGLGGWMLRLFHHLIWWPHCGLLYVDDFLFYMAAQSMPLAATLCCIFCQLTQIPISWRKSELGSQISWIGWNFNFRAGTEQIPESKIQKLKQYIQQLLQSSRCTRKQLKKTIGLLMWITQLFPLLRIWIHYLYSDLYSIPATHFSVDPGDWPQLSNHLSDDVKFELRPQNTAIPVGSTLPAVKHNTIQSKSKLQNVRISTEKRIWLRIPWP